MDNNVFVRNRIYWNKFVKSRFYIPIQVILFTSTIFLTVLLLFYTKASRSLLTTPQGEIISQIIQNTNADVIDFVLAYEKKSNKV